jgi:hypothetical protein
VGLERAPLSLVSTTEELLERKSSGSGLENLEYGSRDPSRWPYDTSLCANVGTNFAEKRRSLDPYINERDNIFVKTRQTHCGHPEKSRSIGRASGYKRVLTFWSSPFWYFNRRRGFPPVFWLDFSDRRG